MNGQLSGQPANRWWWLVGIIAVIFIVLLWGFRTAIQMEEGPGDDSSYSVYDDAAPAAGDAAASDAATTSDAAPAAQASGDDGAPAPQ